MTRIELQDVTKTYASPRGDVTAVRAVSLRIEPGEFFFLLGPSGCGKTTLLRMIAGLIAPTSGRIFLGGRDVTDLPPEERSTAMVFQSYALWPHMTVARNVEFGPRMHGLPRDRRRERVTECLSRVEMQDCARRKPNELSGGQQQRVAVARALAAGADCLLLDEPLSNLDARLRMHMRVELRGLVKAAGTTAVYVTHDQKEALSMADRIAVMRDGRIVQIGTPEEIYNRPAGRFVADFVGEANFIDGVVADLGAAARIETPAGGLTARPREWLGQGAPVCCCVRPERIAIAPAPPGTAPPPGGSLRATVESQVYLGEIRQLSCRLANGAVWKVCSLAGEAAARVGDAVVLTVKADDVILLSPGEAE